MLTPTHLIIAQTGCIATAHPLALVDAVAALGAALIPDLDSRRCHAGRLLPPLFCHAGRHNEKTAQSVPHCWKLTDAGLSLSDAVAVGLASALG